MWKEQDHIDIHVLPHTDGKKKGGGEWTNALHHVLTQRGLHDAWITQHDQRGLTREWALSLSLHFTRAQFFAGHDIYQRVHSSAASSLSTVLYTKGLERQREATPLFTIFTLKPQGGQCTQKSTPGGSYRTYKSLWYDLDEWQECFCVTDFFFFLAPCAIRRATSGITDFLCGTCIAPLYFHCH